MHISIGKYVMFNLLFGVPEWIRREQGHFKVYQVYKPDDVGSRVYFLNNFAP
jgi:hypothetical protein